MRTLLATAALLLAFPAYAVEVPSQADHDALSGRVDALESQDAGNRLDALEQWLQDLQGEVDGYHAPPDATPTVGNTNASCDEEVLCSGDVMASDPEGPATVTWTPSVAWFAGNPDGTWEATAPDGAGFGVFPIDGEVCDAAQQCLPFILEITVNDTVVPPPPAGFAAVSAVTEKTYDQCLAELAASGGGWCEMRVPGAKPSIAAVYPEPLPGSGSPSNVLVSWNSGAWDGQCMYVMGGGHGDWGGNEVYKFCVKGPDANRWVRLTDSSPLDFYFTLVEPTETEPGRFCKAPDMRQVPGSSHNYDGFIYSNTTDTLFLGMLGAGTVSCSWDDAARTIENSGLVLYGKDEARGQGVFEFNPSATELRNGLAPLTWRRVLDQGGIPSISYPRAYEMANGNLALGTGAGSLYEFDPVTREVGEIVFGNAPCGDGIAEYFAEIEMVVSITGSTTRCMIRSDRHLGGYSLRVIQTFCGKTMALRTTDNRIYCWDGKNVITSYDPRFVPDGEPAGSLPVDYTPEFTVYDWDGEPTAPTAGDKNRVFGKWRYIADDDVFVGISMDSTGMWVYMHPDTMEGAVLSSVDPQSLINQASAGDTVTIEPGIYNHDLVIDRSLTVNMAGVNLWGSNPKAIVLIQCDGCEVTINDFRARGARSNAFAGNRAGIKVEGIDWHVIVNRADIRETGMGILTDNRGGTMEIYDSLLKDIHCLASGNGQEHALYIGIIDEFIIKRTVVDGVCAQGQNLKSRAKRTTVEDVQLLQGTRWGGRVADFACGGIIAWTRVHVEHGPNTDNPDIILDVTGDIPTNCAGHTFGWVDGETLFRPTGDAPNPDDLDPTTPPFPGAIWAEFTFEDVTVEVNRTRQPPERARGYGDETWLKANRPWIDPQTRYRFITPLVIHEDSTGELEQLVFARAEYLGFPARPAVPLCGLPGSC